MIIFLGLICKPVLTLHLEYFLCRDINVHVAPAYPLQPMIANSKRVWQHQTCHAHFLHIPSTHSGMPHCPCPRNRQRRGHSEVIVYQYGPATVSPRIDPPTGKCFSSKTHLGNLFLSGHKGGTVKPRTSTRHPRSNCWQLPRTTSRT